ncbi:MAG: hypothetical protein JRD89_09870 [Deltaproteobacteria bacterium]|nr:hypothetical protein [Deltaproteobacteria bacterium]
MARSTIGLAWLAVIVTICEVMIIWGLFHDIVTNLLYNIGIEAGGDPAILDFIVNVWKAFPVLFLIAVIVWAIVVSARVQEDTYQYP